MTKKKNGNKYTQKPPQDRERYVSPLIAGYRLIELALHHILQLRAGVHVKWEMKLSLYYDPTFSDDPEAPVRLLKATFTSGLEPGPFPPESGADEAAEGGA